MRNYYLNQKTKFMENPFFNFSKPYLNYIDKGEFFRTPFNWLYKLLAIGNAFLPFYVMYLAIDNNIFDSPAKYIITFLLIWIVITFASWISFQLFWDRSTKVNETSKVGDEFVATPVFSHLIQTTGEWMGTWIAIVGTFVALVTTVFLGEEGRYLTRSMGVPFLKTGFAFIILMAVYGFLIVVFSRFIAEQFRALSSIANNTKKN